MKTVLSRQPHSYTSLLLLLVGGIIGWGLGVGFVCGKDGEGVTYAPKQGEPVACDPNELNRQRAEVARLQEELRHGGGLQARATQGGLRGNDDISPEGKSSGNGSDEEERASAQAIQWRISALEKFVPLTPDQRERLRAKYEREATGGEDSASESLESIIGEEGAGYYRAQVQEAFKRAHDEEVDREVVWLSRKLALSAEQEREIQGVLMRAEEEIAGQHQPSGAARSPQERVAAMIEENRRRGELKNRELKRILTADQYQAYLRMEAESAASDVELFHEPPRASPTPGE